MNKIVKIQMYGGHTPMPPGGEMDLIERFIFWAVIVGAALEIAIKCN